MALTKEFLFLFLSLFFLLAQLIKQEIGQVRLLISQEQALQTSLLVWLPLRPAGPGSCPLSEIAFCASQLSVLVLDKTKHH